MSKKIITGAVIGTLIGAITIALSPKRRQILEVLNEQSEDFNEKVKQYAEILLKKGKRLAGFKVEEERSSFWWKTSIAGLLLGLGTAMFLTPKSGKQLRGQASRFYRDLFGKAQNMVRDLKNNSRPIFTFTNNHPVKKRRSLLKSKS